MRILTGEPVARFVSERLGFGITPPYVSMGIERDGVLTGGIIFSCFEGCDIRATVAGTGWTRAFLQEAGKYVFGQLGCERVTFVTEQPKVAELALRLGGLIEGNLRSHFGHGRDAMIIGIVRDDYRYLRTPVRADKALH